MRARVDQKRELDWLTGNTAGFARMDRRIEDLIATLANPAREKPGEAQDPDGSWARHMITSIRTLSRKYEYHFLDRMNSPAKLRDYFDALWVSDMARTGIDNRRAFSESLSDLMRLILRDRRLIIAGILACRTP
jgi:hypothetical protein